MKSMVDLLARCSIEKASSLLLVVLVHAIAFHELWQYQRVSRIDEAVTLFVHFVAPPPPASTQVPNDIEPTAMAPLVRGDVQERAPALASVPDQEPLPVPLRLDIPVVARAGRVESAQPLESLPKGVQAPVSELVPPVEVQMPLPAGPVSMGTELAAGCSRRAAPAYPSVSLKFRESGLVVLRVELNDRGRVDSAQVERSSGHVALDNAALSAVRRWRCSPAMRDGKPVRAVALQPFEFVLNGN